MENRLKERLTGAAILVALIVLLVPEMFRGQSAELAASVGASAEGPPVRSYTIDLSNSATGSAPMRSSTAEAASASEAGAAAPSNTASKPPLQASVTAHMERPRADPPAEPRTSEGDGQGAQSGWSVQLGLFAQRENAERLMHAAQQKGFAVRISQPDAKGRYRVHVAGLADRAAAQNLLLRLKAQGLAASVVAPQ